MNVKHFLEDKLLVFEFQEELDHHSSKRIKERLDYEIQRLMPKKVIFDFKNVKFMDSAGIGLIIGRYKTALHYGGELEIVNVNERIKRVFEISGILKIISVLDGWTLENKSKVFKGE